MNKLLNYHRPGRGGRTIGNKSQHFIFQDKETRNTKPEIRPIFKLNIEGLNL